MLYPWASHTAGRCGAPAWLSTSSLSVLLRGRKPQSTGGDQLKSKALSPQWPYSQVILLGVQKRTHLRKAHKSTLVREQYAKQRERAASRGTLLVIWERQQPFVQQCTLIPGLARLHGTVLHLIPEAQRDGLQAASLPGVGRHGPIGQRARHPAARHFPWGRRRASQTKSRKVLLPSVAK